MYLNLEAFAMNDSGTSLVEFLLGDPHFLEGGKRSQDGATDPDRVFPLGRSDDLDLHGGRSHAGDLLLHTIGDTGVHGGATGEDGVGVEILTDIDVTLHDRVEATFLDADDFHAQERGTEHGLGAAETLVADGDDLTIGQLVGLLDGGGGGGGGHLLLEVEGDVAKPLLDVADDLALGGGDQRVASLGHDLHEVIGQVASGQVKTQDGMREGKTLVDGDGVRDTISNVEDKTGGTARGVEGKHSLDTDVHGWAVEHLEGDLRHLFPVGLRVKRSLRVEDGRLIWRDSQLVVEGVMPDLLHVIPVGDDTVLDGVHQREDTPLGLSLLTDVGVLVAHADHDTGVFGPADDRGEDGARSVITGEAGLAHAGAIVDNQSGGLFVVVTHFDGLKGLFGC